MQTRELDRFLNPGLGPFPVKPNSKIDYNNFVATDEDDGKIGRLIPQPDTDEAHKKVSHLSFFTGAAKG
jgi:hypothetical protein